MIRVKICGITRPADALLAAELGAWAVGAVFAPESPRRVTLKQAAEVMAAAGSGTQHVGVFVNPSLAEIVEAVTACGLSVIQLHGEETPEFCIEAGRRSGAAVIKALRVADRDSLAGVVRFDTEMVLLDTYHPGSRGGTGIPFDWSLTRELPRQLRAGRIILSGGLDADNIVEAVRVVSPFAVDVSSGVELAPGEKDPESMKRLFQALGACGLK